MSATHRVLEKGLTDREQLRVTLLEGWVLSGHALSLKSSQHFLRQLLQVRKYINRACYNTINVCVCVYSLLFFPPLFHSCYVPCVVEGSSGYH